MNNLTERPALTFHNGQWIEGNAPLFGALTHGMWLGSFVFDGARAFDGLVPDLRLHCARCIESAKRLHMAPNITADHLVELCLDGVQRLGPDKAYYLRPMIWCDNGFIVPDPDTTLFAVTVWDMPMPDVSSGFSAMLSSYRRPARDQAPTDSKSSCLYPNAGRAMADARAQGFNNAVVLDPVGNVAEFASANLFLVKDGTVITPAPNGSFLNGITRQRVIALLEANGIPVLQMQVTAEDLEEASEIFSTGNHAKLSPVTRYGTSSAASRSLPVGPIFKQARTLYMDYAKAQTM